MLQAPPLKTDHRIMTKSSKVGACLADVTQAEVVTHLGELQRIPPRGPDHDIVPNLVQDVIYIFCVTRRCGDTP